MLKEIIMTVVSPLQGNPCSSEKVFLKERWSLLRGTIY
jgi:hypothetical protein